MFQLRWRTYGWSYVRCLNCLLTWELVFPGVGSYVIQLCWAWKTYMWCTSFLEAINHAKFCAVLWRKTHCSSKHNFLPLYLEKNNQWQTQRPRDHNPLMICFQKLLFSAKMPKMGVFWPQKKMKEPPSRVRLLIFRPGTPWPAWFLKHAFCACSRPV